MQGMNANGSRKLTQVPNLKLNVLVGHGLNIESDSCMQNIAFKDLASFVNDRIAHRKLMTIEAYML